MEVFGYISAILIGISLGITGSGGSILTVPVLVYLMGVSPVIATTSSLFIVGITSMVGGIRSYRKGRVDFKVITEFGLPSIVAVFITRHHLLPAIPDVLFYIQQTPVTKDTFLMVLFAILMLAASLSMIFSYYTEKKGKKTTVIRTASKSKDLSLLIGFGLLVGTVTGLLGAGGGFLIIPALVILLKKDIRTAVGTSLMLIAINALFGFLFSLNQFHYNWNLLLSFTILAIGGLFIGSMLAEKIPANIMKRIFGFFILIMGLYILIRETLLNT